MDFGVKTGRYQHFKGNFYVVYSAATDEDGVTYVLYQHDYGTKEFWIRPACMFYEVIERDGKTMQRFSLVSESTVSDSFEKLMKINSDSPLVINHSETLEKYKISSIEKERYSVTISKI